MAVMEEAPARTPLEDPAYQPEHPPIGRDIPDVIAKWGPRSQLRWFQRYGRQLGARKDWHLYYCTSPHHRGLCCFSCDDELEHGIGVQMDGWCCCRDERISTG